ncbi:hypothetical protein GCM10010468_37200 [Actinocorallia longicatena]|uniref:Uncharacterized protein n=2 Tax=Actinocorallia longicatena TaxID=111803 RepID=A0ABP6QBN3_9ACTN
MIVILLALIGGLVNVLLDRDARTDLGSKAILLFAVGFAGTLAVEREALEVVQVLLMI